jgi:hypothetical protein
MATPISKITLTIDNREYIFGLQRAEAETKKFGNEATTAFNKADAASNKLNLSAGNLTGGLLKLRGTLATIGLGAFGAGALKSADDIMDLSDATAISISKLLEFRTALERSGVPASDLGKVITTFYQSIEEANAGSDKAIETFAKLGVSFKDLKNLSEADLLDKTIRGFDRLTDPAQRSAVSMNLFSKAMRTADLEKLSQEIDNQRGKFEEQERSTRAAADSIEKFETIINTLKIAFVQAVEPILNYFNVLEDGQIKTGEISTKLRQLGVIIGTYYAGSIMFKAVKGLVEFRNAMVGVAAAQAAVAAGAAASLTGPGAALAAVAAGTAAYFTLSKLFEQPFDTPKPGTPEAGNLSAAEGERQAAEAARVADGKNKERDRERRSREQQVGKELQGQLDAVNRLTDGYRRAAQQNMDRYTTEVELLGKSEYEVELIKGRGEIEKRYADQTTALEERKRGAKGSTLALIQKSIEELGVLKSSELDIFEITRRQTLEYKLQQDEIRRVGDEIELQITRQNQLGDAIREANKKAFEARDAVPASRLVGLSSLEKQTLDIQESARKAGMAAREAYAANFGDIVTVQDGERFAKGLDQITGAYQRVGQAQVEVLNANYAISRSFDTGVRDAFAAFKENATNTADQVKNSFTNFTSGLEDAFVKFVQGSKLSFKDLANSILADLARIAVKKAIVGMASLFGFAAGGQVMADTPIIVGERGPELFVPRSAGAIVPNNALGGMANRSNEGGGTTAVTYNIQAVDAASFRSLVARDPSFIYAVTEQGRRSQPTRSR